MNLTTYFKNQIINHFLRNQAYTPPATVYLGLFTTAPTVAGGGTEVSTGAYARQALAFDAPVGGVSQNTVDIVFPTPTADWGTITHGALFDAATAGNMLLFGSLVQSKIVTTGSPFRVPDGNFDLAFT